MTGKKIEVPKQSKGDVAHALTKAGLSVIPVVGGPAVELFQLLIQPPLEKRRTEWMADVGEKLRELEVKGLKLEDLQKNEEFVSAVMYASHVALRTHKAEKLNALRNAILNVAKGQAPEETVQHLFLNFIDSFTELHLRILKVFQAPSLLPNSSTGSPRAVLEHNIPDLRGRKLEELCGQLWKDLASRGLVVDVDDDRLATTMSVHGAKKRTTGLGDAFLKFIAEPV